MIPNYLYSDTEDLLAFAGLYEIWVDRALPEDDPGQWLLNCTSGVRTDNGVSASAGTPYS